MCMIAAKSVNDVEVNSNLSPTHSCCAVTSNKHEVEQMRFTIHSDHKVANQKTCTSEENDSQRRLTDYLIFKNNRLESYIGMHVADPELGRIDSVR